MAGATHRHPAWYAAVMGTGAVSLAFAAQVPAWGWPWLTWAAEGFLVLASLMALLLLPRYTARLADRPALRDELADAAHGSMLGTLPAGVLVLAVDWGRVGPLLIAPDAARAISAVLLVIGTALAMTVGVTWASAMLHSSPGLEGVNGGWLIPPVMNLLVPLALAPLIAANPGAAPLLTMIGFAFLGIGTVLFLVVLTLLVARLAMRGPLPAGMAPSLWIPLAPAGILGLATLRLVESAQTSAVPMVTATGAGVAVSAMGIGFGLWWAAFAAVELRRIRRAGGPPVHPGWWGFVFPVGAMTLSLSALAAVTGIRSLQVIGLVATAGLLLLWVYVVVVTAPHLRRSAPTPSPPAPSDATTVGLP